MLKALRTCIFNKGYSGTTTITLEAYKYSEIMNKLEQVENLKVKVTTLLDQTMVGTIYSWSSSNKVLALKVSNGKSNEGSNFRLINTAFIKLLQVMQPFSKKQQIHSSKKNSELHYIPVKDIEDSLNRITLESSSRELPRSVGHKIYNTFCKAFGENSVKFLSENEISIRDQIVLIKPFNLEQKNILRIDQNTKIQGDVEKTLKNFWMDYDSERRGG